MSSRWAISWCVVCSKRMMMMCGALTLHILACLSVPSMATEFVWRSEGLCGVNVAYAFLRVNGIEVPYSRVREKITVRSEQGSSLQSVADAIVDLGIDVWVAKTGVQGLSKVALPVIAHLEVDNPNTSGPAQAGHFVLVVSVDEQSVRYVSGSGFFEEVPRDEFLDQWTTYVIRKSEQTGWSCFVTSMLVGASITLGLYVCLRRWRFRRLQVKESWT